MNEREAEMSCVHPVKAVIPVEKGGERQTHTLSHSYSYNTNICTLSASVKFLHFKILTINNLFNFSAFFLQNI